MATLSEIRADIKSRLELPGTEYDSDIDNAIRSAIQEHRGERYWFLRKKTSLTLLTGTNSVSLPSDFGSFRKARLLVNNVYRSPGRGFDKVSFDQLEDRYSLQVRTAVPQHFALFDGNIYVDTTSDADYTLELTYWTFDATEPTADDDTSVWLGDESKALITAEAIINFKYAHRTQVVGNEDLVLRDKLLLGLRSANSLYNGE